MSEHYEEPTLTPKQAARLVENLKFEDASELSEPKAELDRLVMQHSYRNMSGCLICGRCGTAKHKGKFNGFKYWFAGIGYSEEPPCQKAA